MGPDTAMKLCSFASRYYYMCHADMFISSRVFFFLNGDADDISLQSSLIFGEVVKLQNCVIILLFFIHKHTEC